MVDQSNGRRGLRKGRDGKHAEGEGEGDGVDLNSLHRLRANTARKFCCLLMMLESETLRFDCCLLPSL